MEIFNDDFINKEQIGSIVAIAVVFGIKIINYIARRQPKLQQMQWKNYLDRVCRKSLKI